MIKEKIKKLDLSATLKINELSKNLSLTGKDIIKFGFGQSPFKIPKIIVEELKKNADQKSYLPIQGLLELRKSIANYETNKKKIKISPEQIIVGPGSKELMFLLHLAFDGDILLPTPSWVSYKPQSIIANNNYKWIQTNSENNWFPTVEDLEKIVIQNPLKKYLIFLNSPNNPSGQVLEKFDDLCRYINEKNILVLSDEIYSELTFQRDYLSIFKFCPDNVIVSNGLSKWCGAGGWRLGYFVIPNKLLNLMDSMKVLASETFSAVSAPIQYAAISAFKDDHRDYLMKSKKILNAVGNYVYENIKSNNLVMNKPMGGFYLMPEFLNKKFETSSQMCKEILNSTGVALLPGSDFGFKEERLITRLSYTDFDGENFMKNINYDTKIDNVVISNYAPRVVEGVKRLNSWV
tara:strand:+ start:1053 stop:2270 length:1218 start_codon:yes stop_codon:yes gene_type:complete